MRPRVAVSPVADRCLGYLGKPDAAGRGAVMQHEEPSILLLDPALPHSAAATFLVTEIGIGAGNEVRPAVPVEVTHDGALEHLVGPLLFAPVGMRRCGIPESWYGRFEDLADDVRAEPSPRDARVQLRPGVIGPKRRYAVIRVDTSIAVEVGKQHVASVAQGLIAEIGRPEATFALVQPDVGLSFVLLGDKGIQSAVSVEVVQSPSVRIIRFQGGGVNKSSIVVANQMDPAFRGDQEISAVVLKGVENGRGLRDSSVVDIDELEVGLGLQRVFRKGSVEAALFSPGTGPQGAVGKFLAGYATVSVGIRPGKSGLARRLVARDDAVTVFVEPLKDLLLPVGSSRAPVQRTRCR